MLALSKQPVENLLQEIMSKSGISPSDNGMCHPDERPLYLYKLDQKTFQRCGQFLKKSLEHYYAAYKSQSINRPRWLSGLFVFYGAHWYRRESDSMMQRWADLGILPDGFDVVERSRLVEDGLKFWCLEVYRSAHGREWLHTLALNGGIPARVLAGRSNSWFIEYFKAIVSDPRSSDDVSGLSYKAVISDHIGILSDRFNQPEITEQSVRLLMCVMKWRSDMPADLSGENAVAWLDQAHSDWRDVLSLHISDDDVVVKNLIKQLLTIKTAELTRGLRVTRHISLRRKDNKICAWSGSIEIGLDGEGDLSDFRVASHMLDSRFDIHLVTTSSTLKSGRIGVAHAVRGQSGQVNKIRCAPSIRVNKFEKISMRDPVKVELRNSVHGRIEMIWPGGEGIKSEVTVFHQVRSDLAKFVGTGSVVSKHETLLLLAPSEAELQIQEPGTCEKLVDGDNRTLWEVSGHVIITYKSRKYRVQTDQEFDESNRILPIQMLVDSLHTVSQNRMMVISPIRIECLRNNRPTGLDDGRVVPGGLKKNKVVNWRSAQGRLTLHWKDEEGFHLDKVQILALPAQFNISARRMVSASTQDHDLRLTWVGIKGWSLSIKLEEDDREKIYAGASGDIQLSAGVISRLPIKLIDPQGKTTKCVLDIQLDWPAIIHESGVTEINKISVNVSQLGKYTLALPENTRIWFELKALSQPYMVMSVLKGQMNIAEFQDIFEMLLALSEDRGPVVEMSIMGQRPLALVSRPDVSLNYHDGEISNPGFLPGTPVIRQLLNASLEYAATLIGEGLYKLPDSVKGACLVYMREGNLVVSRPVIVNSSKQIMSAHTTLDKCTLIEDEQTRHERLITHLRDINGTDWGQSIRTLIEIVTSLKGLSPRSLDSLRVLPQCPEALCGMLLKAPAEAREQILDLENKLPFLWMSLPFEAWENVQGVHYGEAVRILEDLPGIKNVPHRALDSIRKFFTEIGDVTAWFKGINQSEPIESLESLQSLVGPHINMWDDTVRVQLDDLLNRHAILTASKTFSGLPYTFTPSLLAPLALAAVSHNLITLSTEQVTLVRNALAIDPDYVKIGFVHAMRETHLWEDK